MDLGSRDEAGVHMMVRFLVDTNLIIDAANENRAATAILTSAASGHVELLTTRETRREKAPWPDSVRIWVPPVQEAVLNVERLRYDVEKHYGAQGATKRPPSSQDISLVNAFMADTTLKAIISRDGDLLEAWASSRRARPLVCWSPEKTHEWIAKNVTRASPATGTPPNRRRQ